MTGYTRKVGLRKPDPNALVPVRWVKGMTTTEMHREMTWLASAGRGL